MTRNETLGIERESPRESNISHARVRGTAAAPTCFGRRSLPCIWPNRSTGRNLSPSTRSARLVPSGAVELNRAIAVAEVAGPEAALVIVERIDFEPSELDHYCSLHSTRADLLRRLGRTIDARYAYGRALQLTRSERERRFLRRRIAELPPPAAADCEAFWDNALDRIKAAAEADEIEDAEAPAEDARAQRRRLPADAPDPAAHLEHVQPQLAKRERPPHGADH